MKILRPLGCALLLVCLAVPGYGQAGRTEWFVAGEEARLAGHDSLAREAYLRSIRDADGAEIVDSLSGLAYHHVATMYLNREQDTLAMPFFRRSLAIRDRIFPGPHNHRAHIRTNMGMSMLYYGKPDSAAVLIQEANAIYEELEHPDSLNWLKSLNELGGQAILAEDYGLAYSSSYRAVELCEALADVGARTRFFTYYQATRILHNFDDQAGALRFGEKALAALPATDIVNRSLCLNLIALVQWELGDHTASLRTLQRSLRLAETDPAGTRVVRADAHLYLAEHYAMVHDPDRSGYHDRRCRQLFGEINGMAAYHLRNELSRYDLRDGNYAACAERLNAALAYLRRSAGEGGSTYTVQLVRTLLQRARLYVALRDTARALADLHEAYDLQDRLRTDFTDPASRRYLGEDLRPEIDLGVQLHYSNYLATHDERSLWEAFRLSERARAFSLSANVGRSLEPRETTRLKERVAGLQRQVAWGDTLRKNELEALRIRLARIERRASTATAAIPTLDSARLCRYLQRQQSQLLEYYLSDSLQLAFLLSAAGQLRAFALPAAPRLQGRVAEWTASIVESAYRRKSLRSDGIQQTLDSSYWTRGWDLTRQLLPAALREALLPDGALCIVPDSALSYLPFAALPLAAPRPGPVDYRRLPYLQSRHRVTYAYSGAHLAVLAELPPREYARNLIAFAPGFGADERVASVRAAVRGVPLTPLAFNQDEARSIAAMVPRSEVYCDSLATRERFLQQVGRGRILHLSTHGLVDARHPELSFVAFNQSSGRLDEQQLLYYNDLSRLPIDNELTVLSACETSLGRLARGEAPLSLATAFAAAGARSTLTTLWQVDDRATKELMIAFYAALRRGADRPTALGEAQRSLRQADYFHPYYWAAPTLYGLTGPIDMDAAPVTAGLGRGWSWFAVACVAFAALLSYYHRRN